MFYTGHRTIIKKNLGIVFCCFIIWNLVSEARVVKSQMELFGVLCTCWIWENV